MSGNIKLVLFVVIISLIVASCGNEGTANKDTIPIIKKPPITIDNAGIVPILENSSATSVIYVHNNSNADITGIEYTILNNSTSQSLNFLKKNIKKYVLSDVYPFITKVGAESCSNIPAGQSCALEFTTPNISSQEAQGSMLATAVYTAESGIVNRFDQIINYMKVNNSSKSGVILNSGVEIFGANNPIGYATMYAYASGADQVYTVTNMSLDNPEVTIIQGDITNKQLQSNVIQPVEIMAPISDNASTTTINITSESGGSQYTNNAEVNVKPVASKAILVSGSVPLIDTSVAFSLGKLYISNTSGVEANLINIHYPSGITPVLVESSSCQAGILNPYTSCTIYFSVQQASSGHGDIIVNYNNGTLSQTITWFNSKNDPLVVMNADPNPLDFFTNIGKSTKVTVTNVGGYNLTDVTVLPPVINSGTATAIIESGSTCTGNLNIGAFCIYKIFVNSNIEENGSITSGILGVYNNGLENSYSNALNLSYTSNHKLGLLEMSADPNPVEFVVKEGKSTKVTVTNVGGYDFTNITVLEPVVSIGEATAIIESGSTCVGTLEIGESCTYTVFVNDSIDENGYITLGFSGFYNDGTEESYNSGLKLNYASNGGLVFLQMNTNPESLNFGIHAGERVIVTITNAGEHSLNNITIPEPVVLSGDAYVTVESGSTCVGTLEVNESCTYTAFVNNSVIGNGRIKLLISGDYNDGESIYSNSINVNYTSLGYFAYVTNDSGAISMYSLDPSTGNLIHITNINSGGISPAGIVTDRASKYAYVVNAGSNTISMFTINKNGILESNGIINGGGGILGAISIDPSGQFVYVLQQGNNLDIRDGILMYNIGIFGSLIPNIPPATFSDSDPVGIAVDPLGRYVYMTFGLTRGGISVYTLGERGKLDIGSTGDIGNKPAGIAADPTGQFVYIANNGSHNVSAFRIGNTPQLSHISDYGTGYNPYELAIDPTGKYLYVVNGQPGVSFGSFGSFGSVSMFNINQISGMLSQIAAGSVPTGTDPKGIAIDPTGKFVYVVDYINNEIALYSINPSDGSLAFQTNFPSFGTGPRMIAITLH